MRAWFYVGVHFFGSLIIFKFCIFMIWCLRDQQFFLSFCLKKLVTKQNWSLFIYTFDLLRHNFKRQISCKFFWGQLHRNLLLILYCFLCIFSPSILSVYSSVLQVSNFSCMLVGVRVMVFNTTFNNILFISWRSVWLVEETGGPWENHRPAACHLYDIYINTCIYIIFF
jgi:hypothetical protein